MKEQISLVLKVSHCVKWLCGLIGFDIQVDNIEIPMEDPNKVVFYYIQKLLLKLKSDKEKSKRVWDHTFT